MGKEKEGRGGMGRWKRDGEGGGMEDRERVEKEWGGNGRDGNGRIEKENEFSQM